MSHRSAGRALGHLIKSHIPENPEEYAMDYQLQSRGKRIRATLIIIRKELLDEIHSRFPGTPLWIPPEPGVPYLLDGSIVARGTGSSASSQDLPVEVRSGTPEFQKDLYFPTTRKKRPLRTWGFALPAILPFAAFFAWTVLEKQQTLNLIEETTAGEKDRTMIEEITRLEEAKEDAAGEWEALLAARPVNAAAFIDVLAQESPPMNIQSMTLRDREFQIRAQSEDPILVMKALSESPFFSDVKVSDIRPLPNSSRKGFSLTGGYHGP